VTGFESRQGIWRITDKALARQQGLFPGSKPPSRQQASFRNSDEADQAETAG